MQIVIEIPEGDYINLKNAINSLIENGVERDSMSKLCLAVLDGTLLPKGHGKLIDVSEYFKKEFGDAREFLDKATTIIEADKAESEDME